VIHIHLRPHKRLKNEMISRAILEDFGQYFLMHMHDICYSFIIFFMQALNMTAQTLVTQ